jgi:hypothetical protein
MAWCDPCAADPLSYEQLTELSVSWIKPHKNAGQDVFVTRLHMRYDKNTFRKDLMFKITGDTTNFQGRFIMNHPFKGKVTCEAGKEYIRQKRVDLRTEALTLHDLTGWNIRQIEKRIRQSVPKIYW